MSTEPQGVCGPIELTPKFVKGQRGYLDTCFSLSIRFILQLDSEAQLRPLRAGCRNVF